MIELGKIILKFGLITACIICFATLVSAQQVSAASFADFRQIEDEYTSGTSSSQVQFKGIPGGVRFTHMSKNKKDITVISFTGKDIEKRNFRMVITEGASFTTLYSGKTNLRGIISYTVTDGQRLYREVDGQSKDGKFINIFEVHGDREIAAHSYIKYSFQDGYIQISENAKDPSQVRSNEIQKSKDYSLFVKLIDSFKGRNPQDGGLSVNSNDQVKQAERGNFYFGLIVDGLIKFLLTTLQVVVLVGMFYMFLIFITFFMSMYLGIDIISKVSFGSISINDDYDDTIKEFKKKTIMLIIIVAIVFSNKIIDLIIYLLNILGFSYLS